jgi:hypothetical protein
VIKGTYKDIVSGKLWCTESSNVLIYLCYETGDLDKSTCVLCFTNGCLPERCTALGMIRHTNREDFGIVYVFDNWQDLYDNLNVIKELI